VLHQDAATDHEYLQYYYPVFVALTNKGGLCLVATHIFPFGGKTTLQHMHLRNTRQASHGDRNTVKDADEKLVHDEKQYNLFLNV